MVRASFCVLFALLAPAAFSQNEALFFKFDAIGASKVINYASETGIAPAECDITSTDVSAFAPGRFGSGALRGSNTGGTSTYSYVDTRWAPNVVGDFAVAFFMRERVAPGSATYLFGVPTGGSFRCFTGGAAGTGLRVTSAGTAPLNLDLTTDVQSLARTRWVHLSLTVDTSRSQAVWWIDGVPQSPITLAGGANFIANAGLRIGGQLSNGGYDLDDYRFLLRSATPLEIQSWAQRTEAKDAPYGTPCGAQLIAAGGEPTIGNANYHFNLGGVALSPGILSFGSSRSNFGGIPLPLDLGFLFPVLAGCGLESDFYFSIAFFSDAQGGASIAAPIPVDPTLAGATFYNQALFLLNGAEQTSNGVASSLGF